MSNPKVYLAACQYVLLQEIATPELKRRDIAKSYRLALESQFDCDEVVDWDAVNTAIITRWSISGLEWIKKQAWSGQCFAEPAGRTTS